MPWAKGQSGNPGGRPKENEELKALAREHTEAAVNTLVSIMEDTEAPHAARVTAATSILDRGHGKPKQQIEHSGDAENPVAVAISVAAASLAAKLGAK